ncbi:MAG: hypothetical protein WA952_10365 [Lewinella sp.]
MRIRIFRFFVLFLFFGLPVAGFAQKTYQPGYLIDGNGKREAVQILNKDWRYNPTEIQVRRTADQDPITVPTEALREFGIDGKARYINRHVAIEKSSVSRTTRNTTRPVQEVERVLLRVEVEGEASLYSYRAPRVTKYFLTQDGGQINQLMYTVHRAADGGLVETRTFVRQLQRLLTCDDSFSVGTDLNYKLAALTDVIMAYNTCASGGEQIVYGNETSKGKSFYLTLQPGFYYTDYKLISAGNNERILDSENRLALRIGVAAEYVLPYGANTFSVLFQPSYYRFSAPAMLPEPSESESESEYLMEYAAFDLPVAFRAYHFLQRDIKVFASGGVGVIIPFGELYENGNEVYKMKGMLATHLEVGVRYRERYNLAIGYESQGNSLLSEAVRTRTSGLRITTGYTLQ